MLLYKTKHLWLKFKFIENKRVSNLTCSVLIQQKDFLWFMMGKRKSVTVHLGYLNG